MGIPNYEDELNNILEEQDETDRLRQDERWTVTSLNSAIWVDSIIREKEVSILEKESIADESIAKLQEKIDRLIQWKEESTKKERKDIEFFKTHLTLWHMSTIDAELNENETLKAAGKKEKPISKTIKLPYRDLTYRAQQPEALVNGKEITKAKDDPSLVSFVKANNPEFIKEEVQWGEYKKTLTNNNGVYIDSNGQVVDVISLVEKPAKFDWKVKE